MPASSACSNMFPTPTMNASINTSNSAAESAPQKRAHLLADDSTGHDGLKVIIVNAVRADVFVAAMPAAFPLLSHHVPGAHIVNYPTVSATPTAVGQLHLGRSIWTAFRLDRHTQIVQIGAPSLLRAEGQLAAHSGGSVRVLPTSSITQRDGTTGRDAPDNCALLYPGDPGPRQRLRREVHGRPAACRNPGLLDDSGLASASRSRIARSPQAPGRQPGHPGARSSSPAASGRPGRAPVHPLRRDPRYSTARGTVPARQARRTGTPAHHGNPGRPCRRQKRTSAPIAALHKYTD